MCWDIYCYKISSFSELTANSLENFWWEQKPGKTQLPRFCFVILPRKETPCVWLSGAPILAPGSAAAVHHTSPGWTATQPSTNTPPRCWCWDLLRVFSLPRERVCGMFFHLPHPCLAPTLPSARARLGWPELVLALATAMEICSVARELVAPGVEGKWAKTWGSKKLRLCITEEQHFLGFNKEQVLTRGFDPLRLKSGVE